MLQKQVTAIVMVTISLSASIATIYFGANHQFTVSRSIHPVKNHGEAWVPAALNLNDCRREIKHLCNPVASHLAHDLELWTHHMRLLDNRR